MESTKEDGLRQLIVDLYAELKSGDRIARKMDISRKTVYRLLHEAGVNLPHVNHPEVSSRRKGLQGETALAAARDYKDGMKLSDLQTKYGVGETAIRRAATDAGVELRPHGAQSRRIKDEDAKEMARLYQEDHWSQAQISAKFRCAQAVVSRALKEQGVKILRNVRGSQHGNWKGGKMTTGQGYIYIYVDVDDPMASMRTRTGYVLEHRLVMARKLGRPLADNESVHHINGDRSDNSDGNLQLRQGKHGAGTIYQCADCGSLHVVPVKIKNIHSSKDYF